MAQQRTFWKLLQKPVACSGASEASCMAVACCDNEACHAQLTSGKPENQPNWSQLVPIGLRTTCSGKPSFQLALASKEFVCFKRKAPFSQQIGLDLARPGLWKCRTMTVLLFEAQLWGMLSMLMLSWEDAISPMGCAGCFYFERIRCQSWTLSLDLR